MDMHDYNSQEPEEEKDESKDQNNSQENRTDDSQFPYQDFYSGNRQADPPPRSRILTIAIQTAQCYDMTENEKRPGS